MLQAWGGGGGGVVVWLCEVLYMGGSELSKRGNVCFNLYHVYSTSHYANVSKQ